MNVATETSERDWLKGQVEAYSDREERYKKYCSLMQGFLEAACHEIAPLAMVTARTKAVPSFAEKALRQRTKYGDPVNEFTDLCGARIVVRTRSEVETVSEFIKENFDIDWENSSDTSQRLKPTQFGYRSVHYIASFKRGLEYGIGIPEQLYGLKAEVQIRTFAEHAWADFGHDVGYKGAFELPDEWKRQLAVVAAMVEAMDEAFSRVEQGLETYSSSYGAYMDEKRLRGEIERLETVLKYDPRNDSQAWRLGRLWMWLEDWKKVDEVLAPYAGDDVASSPTRILRDRGYAMCRAHRGSPNGRPFRLGQRYLRTVCEIPERDPHKVWYPIKLDPEALSYLADTYAWAGDEDQARLNYRRAFELDPTHFYAFANSLLHELRLTASLSIVEPLRPAIGAAIDRCRAQARVGVDLPRVHFGLGTFLLLLQERKKEEPYEDLKAYAKAVQAAGNTAGGVVADWVGFLSELSGVELEAQRTLGDELPGCEWARRLLLLGLAANFPGSEPGEAAGKELKGLGSGEIQGPVVIVVGGTHPEVLQKMKKYRSLMLEAFRDFQGTIISGGTKEGVSGLVGEVGAKYRDRVHTLGYLPLPEELPSDATPDDRYSKIRIVGESVYTIAGEPMFTPVGPLQNWIDIVSSGIQPATVRVLGINGGDIAAVEFRIALALGATVGVIEDSGRQAAQLLTDEAWAVSEKLVPLPHDPATVRAFIGAGASRLDPFVREEMAKEINERHRQASAPTLAKWDDLPEMFKYSCRAQADNTIEKLRQIGCTVHNVVGEGEVVDRETKPFTGFTEKEVEFLAELEHGRWNAERLSTGWRWGETKDEAAKISPYLVPWEELPEKQRQWDREAVLAIPEILAKVGKEIRRSLP